jgi:hypothetical protein
VVPHPAEDGTPGSATWRWSSRCRAHGRSLLGAAPAELIGEVPDRWVVAAGDAQLADWQAIGTTRRAPS